MIPKVEHIQNVNVRLHVVNTQNENEGFYTYKTPETKVRDSTYRNQPKRK